MTTIVSAAVALAVNARSPSPITSISRFSGYTYALRVGALSVMPVGSVTVWGDAADPASVTCSVISRSALPAAYSTGLVERSMLPRILPVDTIQLEARRSPPPVLCMGSLSETRMEVADANAAVMTGGAPSDAVAV